MIITNLDDNKKYEISSEVYDEISNKIKERLVDEIKIAKKSNSMKRFLLQLLILQQISNNLGDSLMTEIGFDKVMEIIEAKEIK